MATREITIRISNDYTFLGDDAQREDLDRFSDNLETLIRDEFPGVVPIMLRGSYERSSSCPDDEVVDSRLREIATGDEWISLL